MKAVFDEYGGTILLVIVTSMCLLMFANVWFGSGSMVSNLATGIFHNSTSDMTDVSTDETMTIVHSNYGTEGMNVGVSNYINVNLDGIAYVGTTSDGETKQQSAGTVEDISKRTVPKLYALGIQNKVGNGVYNPSDEREGLNGQLLINKEYATTDLFYAVDADGNKITTTMDSGKFVADNSNKDAHDGNITSEVFDETGGFMRVLSVAQANGNEIISNCADADNRSIAYITASYSDKMGSAGSDSYALNNGSSEKFIIKNANNEDWLTYDVLNQKWYFYKSGTYVFRVYVCDKKGKSTTGTIYVSIARDITQNQGDGNNTSEH